MELLMNICKTQNYDFKSNDGRSRLMWSLFFNQTDSLLAGCKKSKWALEILVKLIIWKTISMITLSGFHCIWYLPSSGDGALQVDLDVYASLAAGGGHHRRGLSPRRNGAETDWKRVHFTCFAMAMTPPACFFIPFYPNTEYYILIFQRSMFTIADIIKLSHSICALIATGIWKVFRMLVRCLFLQYCFY